MPWIDANNFWGRPSNQMSKSPRSLYGEEDDTDTDAVKAWDLALEATIGMMMINVKKVPHRSRYKKTCSIYAGSCCIWSMDLEPPLISIIKPLGALL